jgi:demethylmenaquinone methyltransferase/2-methoxy-6-polyprenyl-1,4-benzoquinol methylase
MVRDPYFGIARVYDLAAEPFLNALRRRTLHLLQSRMPNPLGRRVLEVACGTGTQARVLARAGFDVVALDLSPAMLRRAGTKARDAAPGRLLPVQGDAGALPVATACVDAVVVQLALHEMPAAFRTRTLAEIKRVARPPALLVAIDFVAHRRPSPAGGLILMAELLAGPRHYRNGREFLQRGGLLRCLAEAGFQVVESHPWLQGRIRLALARGTTR